MHFLLIGGSGRTGLEVISEALSQNHTLTALVRDPTALQPRTGLHLVQGTPTSPADIHNAFSTSSSPIDGVIVTLAARRASDSPFAKPISPPRFMADCVAHVRAAMAEHGVRKLVVLSALGAGESGQNVNRVLRWMFRGTNMRAQYEDHDAVDRETREDGAAKGLQWVLVRPGRMVEGEGQEVVVWGDEGVDGEGQAIPMLAKVTRQSVARFLVEAAEASEWVGKTPVIANRRASDDWGRMFTG
jgi:uncharacterized protein YbjT (DUF2867 family)